MLPINFSRWTVSKWKQHRSHRPPSNDSQNNGNASVGKIHKSKEANTEYDCEEMIGVVALQGFKYPPEFQSVEYLAFHSV